MDFFTQQDQARKHTSRLVILFALALLTLIVLTNLLLIAAFWGIDLYSHADGNQRIDLSQMWQHSDPQQWLMISVAVLWVVGCASAYRWWSLRGGGQSVAEMLGGRKIALNTDNFYEKRVLNVVEEMALAAGMPVPPVYVLSDTSINAFAAGYQASDAVVGVTRGCIEKLSREQLQGVIAHEFSHILNGDMRLNIRLMALLFGILFIGLIGRMLLDAAMYSRSRRSEKDNRLPLWAVGLGLMVIGYGGVLFGNLIKAAVSRQREFLADASAVQFTRDPSTIGGALKVIGHGSGSEIASPEREEAAHLFFGQAMPFFSNLFATHPPLAERIRRIEPKWDGKYLAPADPFEAKTPKHDGTIDMPGHSASALTGLAVGAALAGATANADESTAESASNPSSVNGSTINGSSIDGQAARAHLRQAASDPYSARILMFTLLLADATNTDVQQQQRQIIAEQQGDGIAREVDTLLIYKDLVANDERLIFVELAIPSLKALSKTQWEATNRTLLALIKADGTIDLFEWCLFRLTTQYVTSAFKRVKPHRFEYGKPKHVAREIAVVLSAIAHHGHDSHQEAQSAFAKGLHAAGFDDLELRLLDADEYTSLKPLNVALGTLVNAYPHVKGRLIKALVACAQGDGEIRPIERDLVTTLAAILECPTPVLDM